MVNKIIDGVGADAEIVTNSRGGKQSKSPMAMHLIDPKFLREHCEDKACTFEYVDEGKNTCVDEEDSFEYDCYKAMSYIAEYMENGVEYLLDCAFEQIGGIGIESIIKVAEVLQYGATKANNGKGYPVNNWRLISREEHLNHALIHIVAMIAGDTQDNHRGHALCRLMMAKATKESENFSYNEYVKPKENIRDNLDDILEESIKHEIGLDGIGKLRG